jgi:hypothetical protein
MSDLISHDIVDTNGVGVIGVAGLPADDDVFSNRRSAIVVSTSNDFGVKNTVKLVVVIDIIVEVL